MALHLEWLTELCQTVKDNGYTSASTSEGNVQASQSYVIHKRVWTEIQIGEEHKEVGTEGTE